MIYSQLDQIDFGGNPFIFEMGHMIAKQDEALGNIENYIKEHQINRFTYPIVIIANAKNYTGDLMVVNNIQNIPQFFKNKSRQLNTKEAQKLKSVQLKQTHMENLILEDFEPTLNNYAKSHKRVFELNNQYEFLKAIGRKIKKL